MDPHTDILLCWAKLGTQVPIIYKDTAETALGAYVELVHTLEVRMALN